MYEDDNNNVEIFVEPNHRAFAFLAAKDGDVKFLEALLGPSIAEEKRRAMILSRDIEINYAESQVVEFQQRVIKLQLEILKKFDKEKDNVDDLNMELEHRIHELMKTCVGAEMDRIGVHAQAYFGVEQPMFPYCFTGTRNGNSSLETMGDFLAKWPDIHPNEDGIYYVKLSREMVEDLRGLWAARFDRVARAMLCQISPSSSVGDNIAYLHNVLVSVEKRGEALWEQKMPISDKLVKLNDIEYNHRCQRFDVVVGQLMMHPSEAVRAYSPNRENLPALLKKAKVPVNSVDQDGNTLLHIATANGKFEVVNLLIERGADLSLKNTNGQTAAEQYNISGDDELKRIAKLYKIRGESQFLEDVKRDFEEYKKQYDEMTNSFWQFWHTKRKIEERARQMESIGREISLTSNLPSDEVLVYRILLQNLQASRGRFGRSKLFDPLIEHVKRFLRDKEYGVSTEVIREALGKEPSRFIEEKLKQVIEDRERANTELLLRLAAQEAESKLEIDRITQEKDAIISGLKEVISMQNDDLERKDRKIVDQENQITGYQEQVVGYQAQILEYQNEIVEHKRAREASERGFQEYKEESELEKAMIKEELRAARGDITLILSHLNIRPAEVQALPGGSVNPQPVQVDVSGHPASLFGNTGESGSGRFGAIPMDNLSSDQPRVAKFG